MVLDLGVSSHQFDQAERGFSYRFDAPLDMRMDRRKTLTARDIVNNYSEQELFHIIRDYGEDPFAKNIAKHIVKAKRTGACGDHLSAQRDYKGSHPREDAAEGAIPPSRPFRPCALSATESWRCLRILWMTLLICESGRAALHYYLSFPGGQNRQDCI